MIEIQNHWPTSPNHQRETTQLLRGGIRIEMNSTDWLVE